MTPNNNSRIKTILFIIGGIVLLAGMGFGTFMVLRQLKPTGFNPFTEQPAKQPLTADEARAQAEEFLKKGDLAQAKSSYQVALDGYTASGNTAAAADVKVQLAMIDASLKSQTAKPQEMVPHQSGSTK